MVEINGRRFPMIGPVTLPGAPPMGAEAGAAQWFAERIEDVRVAAALLQAAGEHVDLAINTTPYIKFLPLAAQREWVRPLIEAREPLRRIVEACAAFEDVLAGVSPLFFEQGAVRAKGTNMLDPTVTPDAEAEAARSRQDGEGRSDADGRRNFEAFKINDLTDETGNSVTAQLGWSGGEGLDEGAGVCGEDCEDVVSLLSGGGDDRPQRGEGLSALDGTESARDFHLHLHHAQRLFGEIVGEWNVEVDQEPQNVVFELVQPKEQVMAREDQIVDRRVTPGAGAGSAAAPRDARPPDQGTREKVAKVLAAAEAVRPYIEAVDRLAPALATIEAARPYVQAIERVAPLVDAVDALGPHARFAPLSDAELADLDRAGRTLPRGRAGELEEATVRRLAEARKQEKDLH